LTALSVALLPPSARAIVIGNADFEPIERYHQDSWIRHLTRAVGQLNFVDNGQQFTCTAFLIADNIAVTAPYCVGRDSADPDQMTLRMGFISVDSRESKAVYEAEVAEVSEEIGFALVKTTGHPG
jgi:hypothetical protein